MAGILALAAGYVIWDNYKRNKEQDNYFKKQAEAKKSREYINNNLSDIKDSVTAVRKDFEGFRKESQRRFDAINMYFPSQYIPVDLIDGSIPITFKFYM